MSIYKRGNKFFVYVPTRSGGRAVRTTGTDDRSTAKAMDRMIHDLVARREWEFLDVIHEGRISVAEMFDYHTRNDLAALRDHLTDVDLQPFIIPWHEEVRSTTSETSDTAQQYLTKVRSLIPAGMPWNRSNLTHDTLSRWLTSRPVRRSTKRKYHAAMSSFCQYLIPRGLLARNPMAEVKAPSPNPPRMRYLQLREVFTLIGALEEPYRAMIALIHGTGMEISVAVNLRCRDFDRTRKEVRTAGTKTANRDRVSVVAEWAWKIVEPSLSGLLPNALVFPNTDRWRALDAQKAACKALAIEDYTLHDARHTYAVIAIRAGAPFEFVAHQLGHANTSQVVKVYGRFRPNDEEKRRWEAIALPPEAMLRLG